MANFLHGIRVIELPSLGKPITTVSSSIIGLIGTAPNSQTAAAATLLSGIVGNNNALTFTAVISGFAGNKISIAFVNPEANSSPLSVSVTGAAINVSLATNSSGAVTSTAAQIITALAGNTAAAALLSASNTSGSSGAGVVTPFTSQFLSGGLYAAFPLNTPVLVTPNSPLVSQLGTTGTLPAALQAIFDVVSTGVIIVNVSAGSDSALSEIIGSSSTFTGVWAFTKAEALTGFAPRILAAPSFSSQVAIAQALDTVAGRIRAIAVIEGPSTTDADAITYVQNFGSDRLYLVDPKIQIVSPTTGAVVSAPNSARTAGVIAATDQEFGFWYSPSNKPIPNIVGTDRPIDYRRDDQYCSANVLNQANIATIINQSGFKLWGNLATSGNFLSQRRIADIIEDSIADAMTWAVDRPVNATYLEDVAAKVNAYLATLKNLGAIIDGKCWPDPSLNTPSNLAAGVVYFCFDFVGPYPAQTIVFRVAINNGYLSEITSSGSSTLSPSSGI